jgi:hypothetical protein
LRVRPTATRLPGNTIIHQTGYTSSIPGAAILIAAIVQSLGFLRVTPARKNYFGWIKFIWSN